MDPMIKLSTNDLSLAKSFIGSDIQREINLAHNGKGAGNFLCALGLLCYTEFAGNITGDTSQSKIKRFNDFFRTLGAEYNDLIENSVDVYGKLRSDLVHCYSTSGCVIYMLATGKDTKGVWTDEHGIFHMCIEKYFKDFMAAFEKL